MKPDWKTVTRVVAGVAALSFSAVGVFAADRHPCSTVVDSAARLACYDAVFGAPATADADPPAGAAAIGSAAAIETAAVQADPAAAFGSEQVKRPRPTSAPEASDSIRSTVRSVSKRPFGELVLQLENGQTWVQQEADSSVRIKPGDAVVIERAALGAYKLVSGHSATRVKRVQ